MTFDLELVVQSEVEFREIGKPPPTLTPGAHLGPEVADIKTFAYTSVYALRKALETARIATLPDHALVRVDIFPGLSDREQEVVYVSCCDQTQVNHHRDPGDQ